MTLGLGSLLNLHTNASVRAALESCGEVRNGANEGCVFIEIYNEDETKCVTLDILALQKCDDATIALWVTAIRATLKKVL